MHYLSHLKTLDLKVDCSHLHIYTALTFINKYHNSNICLKLKILSKS